MDNVKTQKVLIRKRRDRSKKQTMVCVSDYPLLDPGWDKEITILLFSLDNNSLTLAYYENRTH